MYLGAAFSDQSAKPRLASAAGARARPSTASAAGAVRPNSVAAPTPAATPVLPPVAPPHVAQLCVGPFPRAAEPSTAQASSLPPRTAHQVAVTRLLDEMQDTLEGYASRLGRPLNPVAQARMYGTRRPPSAASSSSSCLPGMRTVPRTRPTTAAPSSSSSRRGGASLLEGVKPCGERYDFDIPALKRPRAFALPSEMPYGRPSSASSSLRPPLREQLAAVVAVAEAARRSLDGLAGASASSSSSPLDAPVLTLPALVATVGTLTATGGALVRLYGDRAEYLLHHPHASATEISMVMYYRDLIDVRVGPGAGGRSVVWRVGRPLECFPHEYSVGARGSAGTLTLGFVSADAAAKAAALMAGRGA